MLSFLVDRQGGIWVGTYGQGLWHYPHGSFSEDVTEKFLSDPSNPDTLSEDIIVSIFEDQQGTIWVGTYNNGLNSLDPATGKFTCFKHDPGDPQSLSNNRIRDILEDKQRRMWIGTDDGLNLFNRGTGCFFHYYFDPGDPQSLSSGTVLGYL